MDEKSIGFLERDASFKNMFMTHFLLMVIVMLKYFMRRLMGISSCYPNFASTKVDSVKDMCLSMSRLLYYKYTRTIYTFTQQSDLGTHTTAVFTPDAMHWLEKQLNGSTMRDRSNDIAP